MQKLRKKNVKKSLKTITKKVLLKKNLKEIREENKILSEKSIENIADKKINSKRRNLLPSEKEKELLERIEIPLEKDLDFEENKIIFRTLRSGEYGLTHIDMRIFTDNKKSGYKGFTSSGISFNINLVPEIVEWLNVLYEEGRERDLVYLEEVK